MQLFKLPSKSHRILPLADTQDALDSFPRPGTPYLAIVKRVVPTKLLLVFFGQPRLARSRSAVRSRVCRAGTCGFPVQSLADDFHLYPATAVPAHKRLFAKEGPQCLKFADEVPDVGTNAADEIVETHGGSDVDPDLAVSTIHSDWSAM